MADADDLPAAGGPTPGDAVDTGGIGIGAGLKKAKGPQEKEDLPDWLAASKQQLLETRQWRALTRDVYEEIQEKLKENHIQFFADLTADEKALFVDEVEKKLSEQPVYKAFLSVLSTTVEHKISDAVDAQLRDEENKYTQVELIVRKAAVARTLVRNCCQ